MEKLIYLLGDAPPGQVPRARTDLRDALIAAAPALRTAGAQRVCISVADLDGAVVESIPQFNTDGLIDAKLSFWLDSLDDRRRIERILEPLATRRAGYLVTESVPRAYAKRTWPDGQRSPVVSLVTTFPKPDSIDDETFYARWHGSHTPLSLEIHPLLQYVRNSVARVLTPGAPPFRAIVTESVESPAIAADPARFFRSAEDQKRAVEDLRSFLAFDKVSTAVMSEYILSS